MKNKSFLATLVATLIALPIFGQHSNVAYSDATVRFTVIADGAVRMEYSPDGRFVDNASQIAVIRSYPTSNYKVSKGATITITTPKMILKYKKNSGPFTSRNLSIVAPKGCRPFKWTPDTRDTLNLKGTYRTLDGYSGDTYAYDGKNRKLPLEDGLLSRSGWTLIDDSKSYLFDNDHEWPWVMERTGSPQSQDLYFLAYGNDYKQALKDYTLFAGRTPLPPRYAFGYWWGRYWSYSDAELRDHLDHLERLGIPLDVLVIDMDWHYSDGKRGGWTGYTWNKQLFPEPYKFLNYLRDQRDLKVTLNLHPADGIRPFDTPYKEMAQHMGLDPEKGEQIPYQGSNKKFMTGLLGKVLRPMNEQGVSFWWLDWQQFQNDKQLTNLSNTWWINYAFFTYMQRHQNSRPMLYHRWGGLGNHRYQVGFSGDTYITWESLKYQPYFNSTASNVLYGYWSHDIGGHQGKNIDPELYVRWMQFGALSPILRTHSSKQSNLDKEPWAFDSKTTDILRQIITDRYAMTPYIYTMARQTFDNAISLCRPMYYDHPDNPLAYERKYQYMFGDNMMVCPIGEAMTDNQSKVDVWLPEGNDWYEVATGTLLSGNQTTSRTFLLDEYPLYIKAGSIIPYYTDIPRNLRANNLPITLAIYPGKDNASFTLYEDNGDTQSYATQFATTLISQQRIDNKLTVNISARTGKYENMSDQRKLTVKVFCSALPKEVLLNGRNTDYKYDARNLALVVELPEMSASQKQTLDVIYSEESNSLNLADGSIGQMRRAYKALIDRKKKNCQHRLTDPLAELETIIQAIDYNPQDLNMYHNKLRTTLGNLPQILHDNKIGGADSVRFLRMMGE